MSLFEKLYVWLHEDVARPIAEEFDKLEARIVALEEKLVGGSEKPVDPAPVEHTPEVLPAAPAAE
jgi:hypothetical protein